MMRESEIARRPDPEEGSGYLPRTTGKQKLRFDLTEPFVPRRKPDECWRVRALRLLVT
jgi:hypothetical protein